MSSLKSHHSSSSHGSYTSSAGETLSSTRSTSSSRRLRKGANSGGMERRRIPPSTMTPPERLQLIRNSLTRMGAIAERFRQTSEVQTQSSRRDVESIQNFFRTVQKKLPKMEFNPRHLGTLEKGPQALTYIRNEAEKLCSAAQSLLNVVPEETIPVDAKGKEAYTGLHRRFVLEVERELTDLKTLIDKPAKEQQSRINPELLNDLVRIHTSEFDSFTDTCMKNYISECLNESAHFSFGVYGGNTGTGSCAGVVSALLLDVVVGVRPSRSARITADHAQKILLMLQCRIEQAAVVLNAEAVKPESESPNIGSADVRRIEQLNEYAKMLTRIREALKNITEIRIDWEAEEKRIFTKAFGAEQPLDDYLRMKRMQEEDVISKIQVEHDIAVLACLPFAAPQYYRRNSLSYTQPCHVRLGFRFVSNPASGTPSSVVLPTLSAEYYSMLRSNPEKYIQYADLIPGNEQLWIPFGDIPEMVLGVRCALRRALDPRVDFPRALEEMKELGGYFIMGGGERILRSLLMQRTNIPLNIRREKFSSQGRHFCDKAVVIRSKRACGLTVQNYLYYSTEGEMVLSFSRKRVWYVPILLLIQATNLDQLSPISLFHALTKGHGNDEGVSHARAEALLQHHSRQPYGALSSHLDFLAVLGLMYRQYHQNTNTISFLPDFARGVPCQHDAWYGLFMLRRHILPHLNESCPTPDLSPFATADVLMNWLTPSLQRELRKKFDALLAMSRQLYTFIEGTSGHQGNDVPAYQEVITVSQVLIGAFEACVNRFLKGFMKRLSFSISVSCFQKIIQLPYNSSISENSETTRQLREYAEHNLRNLSAQTDVLTSLITTGNFKLDREEDFYCPQTVGFVVMAEHLNFYRFFEQLRCVHRGKTIAAMRTSEVRKYPSEAYGFICMVHSPDGEDCGVSNYLSVSTIFSSTVDWSSNQMHQRKLTEWVKESLPGLTSPSHSSPVCIFEERVPVWVEGEVIGYVTTAEAGEAANSLRLRKQITQNTMVDPSGVILRGSVSPLHTLEVVNIPLESRKDPPGLYIFFGSGRMMRPVQVIQGEPSQDATKALTFPLMYIGAWEQSWLDIASVAADMHDALRHLGKTYDYLEQCGSNLLSFTSTTIPFFEYNCSPRNLFQCGLSKQSSGTQLQSMAWRNEAKLFRTYFPQRYISRTLPMDFYNVDDVNLGVNAVIAILAYTGYDLDDAVVLNSCASQRGMLNAGITVAKVIHAAGSSGSGGSKDESMVFQNVLATGERFSPDLDQHGLPYARNPVNGGSVTFESDHSCPSLRQHSDVYCCALRKERKDPLTNQLIYEYTHHKTVKWRNFDKGEDAWVHNVVPLEFSGPDPVTALVIFRIPRPPTVGDKLSSRHGQKGTIPLHIRSHDLPFSSVSGIVPDVIINPHAFPSRMTVGMVLEIMVAKVGALEGRFMDNSAWSTVDDTPVVAENIGEALVQLGYNRFGREAMIDGISGEVMEAEVFMGVSGYQRLRHQVNDKWQARARTDSHKYRAVTKTGQPVKGRKHHGGVRVGEMERDALLSHGISEVVLDRLLHVSDKTKAYICPVCGDLLSIYERHATEYATWKTCRFCGTGEDEKTDQIALVEIPQVLRLWAAELMSTGVRVTLRTSDK